MSEKMSRKEIETLSEEFNIDNLPTFPEPKKTDSPEELRRIIREQSKWNFYIANVLEQLKIALIRAELVTGYSVDVTSFDAIKRFSSLQLRFQYFIEASIENYKKIYKYGGWNEIEPILINNLTKNSNDFSDKIHQILPNKSDNECIETIKSIVHLNEKIHKIFPNDDNDNIPQYICKDLALSSNIREFFDSEDDSYIIDLIREYHSQIPKLKEQIKKIKNDSKTDNLNLQNEINKLKGQLNNIKKEKIDIKKRLNNSEKERNHLNNSLKQFKKENNELQCRAKQDKKDKVALQKELEQHVHVIEKLKNLLKSFESKELIDSKQFKPTCNYNIINHEKIDKMKRIKLIDENTTFDVFDVIQEKHFALKVFHEDLFNDDDDIENIKKVLNEYEILNQLNHPNIIKTFGIRLGDIKNSPAILLEYYTSNLKNKINELTKEERIEAIIDISLAMKEVHSSGIIHRDLRLENILLDENNKIKLSGFGLGTLIELESDSMSRSQIQGTFEYMAPELLQEKNDYNEKVDVYAFGVVVFLILTKGEFPKISPNEILNGKKADIPKVITKFSRELIDKCWSIKAEQRPSFDEIHKTLMENENYLF